MSEVPKIVHHRLRAAAPPPDLLERAHLEADLLTAFSEQALAASEREGVLQHLALCADCRDVVALALPELESTTLPMEEAEVVEAHAGSEHAASEHRDGRFSWAGVGWGRLRWAALAAGIAVAVFVVRPGLERMGMPHTAANSAANKISQPGAQPAPASQIASSQIASRTEPANSVTATLADNLAAKDAAKRSVGDRAESATRDVEPKSNVVDEKSGFFAGPRKAILPPQTGMQLAGNMPATSGRMRGSGMKKDSVSAGMAAEPGAEVGSPNATNKLDASQATLSKSLDDSSTTTVEVAAGSSIVSTDEARSADATLLARSDGLTAQNAQKIEKAKPALDEAGARDAAAVNGSVNESPAPTAWPPPAVGGSQAEVKQAEVTSKPRTGALAMKAASPPATIPAQTSNWMIANGVLQHSLDSGHTWQVAARAGHTLLCYASRGQEVWAGGRVGTLLHSADNGATWNAVAVSFNGQSLDSDVTYLSVRGSTEVVLSTDTHETLSSLDGGKTWEKK